ncbi:unnamed protein product [Rotaria sp. Silwood1]|nr:unnamed protein product [Rotaria sp. Silwood1]CAF4932309.1 unnamed protein product [Rotaria sp. Silwood1]
MKLLDGLDGCYRTIVADNFFTSIFLAKYLLEDDTYLIGTLRSNRVGSGSKVLEENLSRREVYGLQNKDGIKLISHFNQLIPTPSTTSNSTSDETKPSQSSSRSREAIQCRNQQRHEKRKLKRRQHVIRRKLHHQWTIPQIKQYLDSLHVRHAYIPHFYNNILRLQFNNQQDQDFADSKLSIDIFDENHYKSFINDQAS